MSYFSNIPITEYNGTLCRNILRRGSIDIQNLSKSNSVYNYTIEDGDRADNISYYYYGDQFVSWLVFYANQISDIYYDYPLSSEDLQEYIVKKYGSIENSMRKILLYKNNYEEDTRVVDPIYFSNLLENEKSFWKPLYNYNDDIIGYERTKDDRAITTNATIELTGVSVGNISVGDLLSMVHDNSTYAEIASINNDKIIIKHIVGDFLSLGSFVLKTPSNSSFFVSSSKLIQKTLSDNLYQYFSLVNCYDFEVKKNDEKRNINLIDKSLVSKMKTNLIGALNK